MGRNYDPLDDKRDSAFVCAFFSIRHDFRHVMSSMFPDYFSIIHHPPLLCRPTNLLLCVIPSFYLLFLSLPLPCHHYVFVFPSVLLFNLFANSSAIFGLVLYNSSVVGKCISIPSTRMVGWSDNLSADICTNMLLSE